MEHHPALVSGRMSGSSLGCVGMWAFQGESPKATGAADAGQFASSNYNTAIDQAADYAMMDNGDIYAYVSGY